MRDFINDLRRRKVFRVAISYAVVAWILIEIAATTFPVLLLPDWALTFVTVLLLLGFPVALIFAWVFDVTPNGIVVDAIDPDPKNRVASSAGTTEDVSSQLVRRQPRNYLFFVTIAVGLTVAAYLTLNVKPIRLSTTQYTNDAPATRFAISLPIPLTQAGEVGNLNRVETEISADGRRVVFLARWGESYSLHIRAFNDLESVPIKGAEFVWRFALSPDGSWIVFQHPNDGQIKKLPIGGGVPTVVGTPGGVIREIEWGPNGQIVFTTENSDGIYQIADSGGEPHPLTVPTNAEQHKHMAFSIDGKSLFYVIGAKTVSKNPNDEIFVRSLDTGESKALIGGSSPSMTTTGHLIFFRGSSLWAVEMDSASFELHGEAKPIVDDVDYWEKAHYSISDSGSLVYSRAISSDQRNMVWVDHEGNEELLPISSRRYELPRLSPDGDKFAALDRTEPSGYDLWVFSVDRDTSSQRSFTDGRELVFVWSNDAQTIFFSAGSKDDVYSVNVSGTPVNRRITNNPLPIFAYEVLEDLEKVLFVEYGRTNVAGSSDIGIFSMDDPGKLEYLLSTDYEESHPDLSPDRKWLAYVSNSSGRKEVYVRPFPNVDDGEWQVSTTGGLLPIWGPSGAKLYFWGPSHIMAVDIESDGGFSAGTTSPLFEHANYIFDAVGNFDLDPNGKRFLMIKYASSRSYYRDRIIVVENWFSELVEAVPTN